MMPPLAAAAAGRERRRRPGAAAHLGRQVRRQHDVALGDRDRALDRVLQLAHVAGPAVGVEQLQRLGRQRRRRAPLAPRQLGQEVRHQDRHVLAPLAQRRQVHGDDVDAEVEVLAEAPGLHLFVEVLVRRAHQAHVDPDRFAAAYRLDLAVLQRAQQLGLHLRPHVADLVEEHRAAVRGLEQAALRRHRAREGAARVAEQLDSSSDSVSAVQLTGTNGAPGARRMRVDRARHQLLAGAGFALDQHRRRRARDARHQLVHLEHHRALAHDVLQVRLALARARPSAPTSRLRSSARATVRRSSSMLNGFET
jgi:hypothetical protein